MSIARWNNHLQPGSNILEMASYSNTNPAANSTNLNKLAAVDFSFVGILIPGLISPCANQDLPNAILQRHHCSILSKTLPKKIAIGLKMFSHH